ncbi:hypothetical protein MRX96_009322 [Rhipicephalus microplus]
MISSLPSIADYSQEKNPRGSARRRAAVVVHASPLLPCDPNSMKQYVSPNADLVSSERNRLRSASSHMETYKRGYNSHKVPKQVGTERSGWRMDSKNMLYGTDGEDEEDDVPRIGCVSATGLETELTCTLNNDAASQIFFVLDAVLSYPSISTGAAPLITSQATPLTSSFVR